MRNFITERVRRHIFCDAVGTSTPLEEALKKIDVAELRNIKTFPKHYGSIHSSIAIHGDVVLILNLSGIQTGVRIENTDFAKTMRTIFQICKDQQNTSPT